MGYLIYKIVFMLMSAAGFGAALAWWWMRRHYEDVTLEHSRWVENWDQWRQRFEAQLAARPAADLSPLADRLTDIERRIDGIVFPPPTPVTDLSPVREDLHALRQRMDAIRIPEPLAPQHVDLEPVQRRLDALDRTLADALAEWRSRQAPVLPAPAPAAVAEPEPVSSLTHGMIRSGSRNLLTHAALGKPDDLQRIKGVAGVLERMLHGIGVYYFWQIAEWTPEDVAHVDRQLTAFKGRILRDHWVRQSQGFAAEPTAARKPAG